jgi:hypothetical protein
MVLCIIKYNKITNKNKTMRLKKALLGMALVMAMNSANAGLLNIEINNLGGLSATQSSIFDDAVIAWG